MSTRQFSDKSVIESRSSIVSKTKGYSDLDLRLKQHPSHRDILPLRDIAAVKQSVRNLILTAQYDRPFQPNLSAGIRSLLFETADNITRAAIRREVEKVLKEHEPRIVILSVKIEDRAEINSYNVSLKFNIINIVADVDLELYLERVR
jgi:phage baseplate assembly protein W